MVHLSIVLAINLDKDTIVWGQVARCEGEHWNVASDGRRAMSGLHHPISGIAESCLGARCLLDSQFFKVLVADSGVEDDEVELGRVKLILLAKLVLHPSESFCLTVRISCQLILSGIIDGSIPCRIVLADHAANFQVTDLEGQFGFE